MADHQKAEGHRVHCVIGAFSYEIFLVISATIPKTTPHCGGTDLRACTDRMINTWKESADFISCL